MIFRSSLTNEVRSGARSTGRKPGSHHQPHPIRIAQLLMYHLSQDRIAHVVQLCSTVAVSRECRRQCFDEIMTDTC